MYHSSAGAGEDDTSFSQMGEFFLVLDIKYANFQQEYFKLWPLHKKHQASDWSSIENTKSNLQKMDFIKIGNHAEVVPVY